MLKSAPRDGMDQVLRAIAEPCRREILNRIVESELSSGEIAAHFALTHTHGAISQHLKVLEDAGLVTARRVGTRRLYQAHPEGMAEIKSVLLYLATCFSKSQVR